jgi:hypothetical protein
VVINFTLPQSEKSLKNIVNTNASLVGSLTFKKRTRRREYASVGPRERTKETRIRCVGRTRLHSLLEKTGRLFMSLGALGKSGLIRTYNLPLSLAVQQYIETCKKYFVPFYRRMKRKYGKDVVIQEDNAP